MFSTTRGEPKAQFKMLHYVIIFAMVAVFIFSAEQLFAVSTINANLATDGTLSVTGVSTLTGGVSSSARFAYGGGTLLAYSSIADAGGATSHATVSGGFTVSSDDDLFVEGVLEVDGGLWLDNNATSTAGGFHFEDSINAYFGSSNDATIDFDGVDLVINPDAVGSGNLVVSAGVSSTESFAFGGGTYLVYNTISDAGGVTTHTDDIASDNDLFIEGSLEVNGYILADSSVSSSAAFAFGGGTVLAYNTISDAGGVSSYLTGNNGIVLNSDDDLFIQGVLEVDTGAYFDGSVTSTAGGFHFNDSINAYFGTANDASIDYDGTNLVLDPNVVGSGVVLVSGGVVAQASSTFSASTTIGGGLNIGTQLLNGVSQDMTISQHLTATSSLDFGALAADACEDVTMTVTGAAPADTVVIGAPATAVSTSTLTFGWVSSANTVSVRVCNNDDEVTTSNPGAATYRADVWRHAVNDIAG